MSELERGVMAANLNDLARSHREKRNQAHENEMRADMEVDSDFWTVGHNSSRYSDFVPLPQCQRRRLVPLPVHHCGTAASRLPAALSSSRRFTGNPVTLLSLELSRREEVLGAIHLKRARPGQAPHCWRPGPQAHGQGRDARVSV